jgi:hypothetical protein
MLREQLLKFYDIQQGFEFIDKILVSGWTVTIYAHNGVMTV